MPIRLGLFYTYRLGNCVHSYQEFCVVTCYQVFRSNINDLREVVWFLVLLSNKNKHLILSNYSKLMIIVCYNTVVWFQVFLCNTNNFKLFYGFKYSYQILIILYAIIRL